MQAPAMMDPKARDVSTYPREFFTEYTSQRDGSLKEEERVKIGKKGDANYERTESVERMIKHNQLEWTVFQPYYDHWKKGLEPPVNGVPLSAFPPATPQLVKALEPYHIKTVEDLAQITDDTMGRISFPRLRGLKIDAQAYLDAKKNTQAIAGEVADLREENARLKDMLAEMQEQIENLKPKRGRPKNEPAHNSQ